MVAKIRIALNKPNIGKMLRSDELVNAMRPYADRIRAAADAGSGDDGHEVRVLYGFDRASMIIATRSEKAKRAEAERRNLTTSLEAGRG